jgi:predicted DNA-binding transcriptional regulator AlpA
MHSQDSLPGRSGSTRRQENVEVRFLDEAGCACRYNISRKSWRRQVDAGLAPRPTRFGRLCRWSIGALEAWEADGCPRQRGGRT